MALNVLHEKLLALISIFREILLTLLECHCQMELSEKIGAVKMNLSSSDLLYHILLNNSGLMKNKHVFNAENRRRVEDPLTKTLYATIDMQSFDITLIISLIRSINATKCFKRFYKRCPSTSDCCIIQSCHCEPSSTISCSCIESCNDCDVKLAVEEVRKLRNAASHCSDNDFEALLNGTGVLVEFPHCSNEEDLMNHLYLQLKILVKYVSDTSNFPLSTENKELDQPLDKKRRTILKTKFRMVQYFPQQDIRKIFNEAVSWMSEEIQTTIVENSNKMERAVSQLSDHMSDGNRSLDRLCTFVQGVEINSTPEYKQKDLRWTSYESNKMKLTTWHSKCRYLYDQLYKNGVNFFDYVPVKNNIERTINDWFNDYVKFCTPPDYSLIARYDIRKHIKFEGKEQCVMAVKESTTSDCILLFSCKDSCVYYIKESISTTSDDIQEDIECLKSEIFAFIELYMETINLNDIKIQQILLLRNVTQENLMEMRTLKDKYFFIFSKEELESKDTFKERIRNFVAKHYDRRNLPNDVYSDIVSPILGFLSLSFEGIPHISDNNFTLTNKIPLTKKQQYVINTDSLRHVFLTGSYSTGKTLVLQKKMMRVIEKFKEEISIYIFLPDSVSLLYGSLKKWLEDYKLVLNEYGKTVQINFSYDNLNRANKRFDVDFHLLSLEQIRTLKYKNELVDIVDILKEISLKENAHVFIDEFNAEELTEEVALNLRSLIENEMKDSTLFIIPQPLQVDRTVHMDVVSESLSKGICFEQTTIKMVELNEAIRNSQHVYELFKEAKDVMQEYSTTYYNSEYVDKEIGLNNSSDNSEKKNSSRKKDEIAVLPELAKFHTSSAINVGLRNGLPIEGLFKRTCATNPNATKVSNSYSIKSESRCGNMILGNLPNLFIPFGKGIEVTDNCYNQLDILHLRLALLNANAEIKGSIIICSSIEESQFCYMALADSSPVIYMPSLLSYDEYEASKNYEKIDDSVLITDFKGVRGTELSNVTIILSTNEYYFAPFFLETITRAVSKLSFVLFNYDASQGDSIVDTLIERWRKKSLVETIVIACNDYDDTKWGGNGTIKRCTLNHHDTYESPPYEFSLQDQITEDDAQKEVKRWLSLFFTKERIKHPAEEIDDRLKRFDELSEDPVKQFSYVWDLIKRSQDEEVKYFITRRPLHALKCDFNRTLLFAPACYNKPELAKYMLDEGFDVYATNNDGWNVLHLAAYNNSVEAVEFFCKNYPILMDLKDNNDKTPHNIAKGWNKHRSVGIINKYQTIYQAQRK